MVQQKLVFSEKKNKDDGGHQDELKPQLRFPEFTDDWKESNLGNLFNFSVAGDMDKELFSEIRDGEFKYPLYANALEKEGLLGYYKESKYVADSITITARGNIGHSIVRKSDFNAIGRLIILNSKKELNNDFFSEYINSNLKIYIESTGVPQLTAPSLKINKVKYPSLDEQNQIANFILAINKKIELLEKKYKNKLIFKEEFFNNYISNMGDEIQKIKLESLIKISTEKNKNNEDMQVLSISNKLGFISQEEQFEDRIVASSDTKNYKIVKKGYFAYNPARINVGSIAQLKDYDEGIVSPMYVVFKIDEDLINPTFFENYISTNYFKIEILKRLEGSVRLILSADSLKNIEINVPPLEEQEKISLFMDSLSKGIELSKKELEKIKYFKKGLLQKMFI